ncbi:Retrotransposon gag protein [Rhizoctonia solani]|uniref:Retrotransposon gag protein n=1 Tax=Rhizoctonia solani TaxID=456999 RepID=A0A8H7M336_9AGAM|nr:Retrotransposon gag protein [Rhizoctonia solani]
MATRSRSSARPPSPLDQGELGPAISATANEPTSLEPKVYREISLGQAISLILGLQNQILQLERELEETKEATKEAKTGWVQSIKPSLASRLGRLVRPRCLGRPLQSSPRLCATNSRPGSPRESILPSTFAYLPLFPQVPQPAAPVAAYQTPVKVDHPDAYTGKIGNKARQWLTRMLAWVHLNQRMFPTDQEVLSFLLMNMKDVAGAWAHPHLDQLGSHRALIQLVDNFRTEFLAAFGNPDATRAAEQQITHLTQTGTCAEYITKFRTIAMDLDWNDAALCGQFARGLHWEVSRLIATQERRPTTLLELQNAALVIDNALCEERASHPPKGRRLSSNPNFVSKEEQNRRQAEGLCIKCGKLGHKFAECRTGWKATPKEESVKKEAAKVGEESGPKSGKD